MTSETKIQQTTFSANGISNLDLHTWGAASQTISTTYWRYLHLVGRNLWCKQLPNKQLFSISLHRGFEPIITPEFIFVFQTVQCFLTIQAVRSTIRLNSATSEQKVFRSIHFVQNWLWAVVCGTLLVVFWSWWDDVNFNIFVKHKVHASSPLRICNTVDLPGKNQIAALILFVWSWVVENVFYKDCVHNFVFWDSCQGTHNGGTPERIRTREIEGTQRWSSSS